MEWADVLHVVWCGVARDAVGSLLMDVAEFGVAHHHGESWDQRLQYLHSHCVQWCVAHRIRPSTVEEFSSFHANMNLHATCSRMFAAAKAW